MSLPELKTRLLLRIFDTQFAASVRASNDALLNTRTLDAGMLHLAPTVEAFLTGVHDMFGDLGFDLEERIRTGFANGTPRRALTYLVVLHAIAASGGRLHVTGVWTPHTVAQLLAIDEAEFAAALYRTLLWRDPSTRERQGVSARLQSGARRAEIIATVAEFPAARYTPVPIEGIIYTDTIARDCDDAEFVDSLYTTLLCRAPDFAGARTCRAALRAGVRRDEIVRRFIEQIRTTFPNRVYVGFEGPSTAP